MAEGPPSAVEQPRSPSASECERDKQLALLTKKEWFFPDVSFDQIEMVLNQGSSSTYLVTNGPFDDQFIVFTGIKSGVRRKKKKHAQTQPQPTAILQTKEGSSYAYYIEGKKETTYDTVVDAVQACVGAMAISIHPAFDQSSGAMEVSVSIRDGEAPPEYTAAVTFPSVLHPLPNVKAKVNVKKAENADHQQAPFEHIQNRSSWSTHLHYYRELHRCHPKNTWHCCCHAGYDEYDTERELYDLRGAGPCRGCLVAVAFCFLCLCCCPCLLVGCLVLCISACHDDD